MPVAKARSESEDSDVVGTSTKAPESNGKIDKDQDGTTEASGEEDDDEDGSEYEIEEVLDAKKGMFPNGRIAYFVKWKGYDEKDNSWVDEKDAGNAEELIKEYWRKNPQKKKLGRKSETKTPKKPRKSFAEESDVGSTSARKRGRQSTDKMDLDGDSETEARATKQQKKSVKQASPVPIIGNMDSYMHLDSWDDIVESIDTVERVDSSNNELVCYLTLKNGDRVKVSSLKCRKYLKDKMIDFYESNLRWKYADDADDE